MLSIIRKTCRMIKYNNKRHYCVSIQSHHHTNNFIYHLRNDSIKTYMRIYENQYNAQHNKAFLFELINDLNNRLSYNPISNSTLDLEFTMLTHIRDEMILITNSSRMNPTETSKIVIRYIETMYELAKMYQIKLNKSTYHTDFTNGFINNLLETGTNTQLFFTFQNMDAECLIDIRPTCIYPIQLLRLPYFASGQESSQDCLLFKKVEGNELDFKEFTFHDLGHAYVMNRQDKWLFSNSEANAPTLIEEWIRNKNWYQTEYNAIKYTNPNLYKAIVLYLFDIVHDRGYQFDLPILRQQFRAIKNLLNIKTKVTRGDFQGVENDFPLDQIDEARLWLILQRVSLNELLLYKKSFKMSTTTKIWLYHIV